MTEKLSLKMTNYQPWLLLFSLLFWLVLSFREEKILYGLGKNI